jgi:hypothetical protein
MVVNFPSAKLNLIIFKFLRNKGLHMHKIVGNYEVYEELGEGEFGKVFRAIN